MMFAAYCLLIVMYCILFCDVLCCVSVLVWCDVGVVMRCDVMRCDVMRCDVMRCNVVWGDV